jgi:hypothetical protein
VVERIIGNDEVGSSILPCGTSFLTQISHFTREPKILMFCENQLLLICLTFRSGLSICLANNSCRLVPFQIVERHVLQGEK